VKNSEVGADAKRRGRKRKEGVRIGSPLRKKRKILVKRDNFEKPLRSKLETKGEGERALEHKVTTRRGGKKTLAWEGTVRDRKRGIPLWRLR